jgi:hypothetical protein
LAVTLKVERFPGGKGKSTGEKSIWRKAIILLLMAAVLWLLGCATVTPVADQGEFFGPCAKMMPYWYCGGGP